MITLTIIKNPDILILYEQLKTLTRRTELNKYLNYLCARDTSIVTKLDRLDRPTKRLIELSQQLSDRDIELYIIDININTNDLMKKQGS